MFYFIFQVEIAVAIQSIRICMFGTIWSPDGRPRTHLSDVPEVSVCVCVPMLSRLNAEQTDFPQ